jgi:hypothetical protein
MIDVVRSDRAKRSDPVKRYSTRYTVMIENEPSIPVAIAMNIVAKYNCSGLVCFFI